MLEQLSEFGSNTLIIIPTNPAGGGNPGEAGLLPTSGKLFDTDYQRVKKDPDIGMITEVIIGSTTISYKDQELNSQIYGVDPVAFSSTTVVDTSSGRYLTSNDHEAAVLRIQRDGNFKQEPVANAVISIGGQPYRVVGILKETGSSFSNIDGSFSYLSARRGICSTNYVANEYSAIYIVMKDGTNMTQAADEIEQIMLSSHRVTEDTKDFGRQPSLHKPAIHPDTGPPLGIPGGDRLDRAHSRGHRDIQHHVHERARAQEGDRDDQGRRCAHVRRSATCS